MKLPMNRGHAPKHNTNLLGELLKILEANNLTTENISAVVLDKSGYSLPFDWAINALDREYNSWYGEVEVNRDLRILLTNGGFISRWVHDEGMESFIYNKPLSLEKLEKLELSLFTKEQ